MEPDIFMQEALKEAKQGWEEWGIPIGSVLVKDGKIIGRGHNKRVQGQNQILHAEIDCLQNAGRIKDFQGVILYSTLMPCYMCAGAAVQFGIKKVVVGESKNFSGAKQFMENHGIEVIDLDSDACKDMMAKFIKEKPELWDEDNGVFNS